MPPHITAFFRPLLVTLLSLLPSLAPAAESAPSTTPRATVSLLSASDALAPGQTVELGLHFRFQPGWHIYWMNPGDAGQAPRIEVFAPAGSTVGDLRWPAPERHVDGPITTFVHQGDVLLPFPLTLPATLSGPTTLSVKASWLVCKDICIPEEGVFRLELPAGAAVPGSDAPLFEAARAAAPVRTDWQVSVDAAGQLTLRGAGAGALRSADFFPADWGRIEHGAAQTLTVEGDVARIALVPGAEFDAARPLEGVLRATGADGVERALWLSTADQPVTRLPVVTLAAGDALPPSGAPAPSAQSPAAGETGGLWPLLFAFAGGLLLNLMPCVFPVLAIKALSFARAGGGESSRVRQQSLAYCAGVVLSFVALAGLLLALRAAGSQAGWGFQFQSPVFVAAMATLLFAIGLNLSGVFDVGGRLASAGSGLAERGGLAGSFFTGVLAVVVATPCTAPFMGGAIAAALSAPAVVTVGIFVALGLGMALPYLLLAFFPALARRMPKPGAWMERLKQALAFPMYGAAAWLVWVLSQQSGADGVLHALVALLLVALAAWLAGSAQRGAPRACLWRAAAVLTLVIAALAVGRTPAPQPVAAAAADGIYSPQRLADLRASGKPVFVNMTAAWCVTCLMNEKVALSTAEVQAAFAARGIVYLKGDWTRADPDITAFLQSHGRDGVPLYVYYPAGGQPVLLPQILTPGVVLAHLEPRP